MDSCRHIVITHYGGKGGHEGSGKGPICRALVGVKKSETEADTNGSSRRIIASIAKGARER